MNPLQLLRGRENEAPEDGYTPEFEGVAPFPLMAMYDRLREATVDGRIENDMTVHEAHAVFVEIIGEGISPEELDRAAERLNKCHSVGATRLTRELVDAYARDYATNSIRRQLADATLWAGTRAVHALGLFTERAAEKAHKTGSKARSRAEEWRTVGDNFTEAVGNTRVYQPSD